MDLKNLIPEVNFGLTKITTERISYLRKNLTPYEAAKTIAHNFLGARQIGTDQALFGFWMPGLANGRLMNCVNAFELELFIPLNPIDFTALKKGKPTEQAFVRHTIRAQAAGDYLVAVVDGVPIGNRETAGTFYWLRYTEDKRRFIVRDPLAASLPFGVYAPAELFDVDGMLANRRDIDYFHSWVKEIYPDGSIRARDIGSHLEIHPETATQAGTIQGLTDRYTKIGQKIQTNIDAGRENMYEGLSPADLNFIGFDTIELTPEVPPAEREGIDSPTGQFFRLHSTEEDNVTVTLARPDISNWGYDTPILGSAAVNPSILGSLRPNELLEFIETIHLMPGRPIQLCIDSVLGHIDYQGARLLRTFDEPPISDDPRHIHSRYLRGPNMYGRDIDFTEPNVKAILLELLIRKINYGFDCIRVDGAQDFIIGMDPDTGLRIQDDDFLNEMANVTQNINGLIRRPDINLEDGRPWPDDLNWLYNSKYLDHTIERTLPFGDRVKQWSPIIFAHNVHGKYKWFMEKWDRFVEVYRYGENWITGHSNHDNVRYFYRMVSMTPSTHYRPGTPFSDYYNAELGATMKKAAHNAMDHNGLSALVLGFMPGNPMFMLNALFHTPWLFMRDIDDHFGLRIAADEGSRFFTWYVDPDLYQQPDKFVRLKELGFTAYRQIVAPPAEKEDAPGFFDVLFKLSQAVKTDALMARYLFDDPTDAGGFADVDELQAHHQRLIKPSDEGGRRHFSELKARRETDPGESERRVAAARQLMDKNRRYLTRDVATAPPDIAAALTAQLEKLDYLDELNDDELALLIFDADAQTEYSFEKWGRHPVLLRCAPTTLLTNGIISPNTLKKLARAFMLDARDTARVHQYENDVDPQQAAFNFTLRRFRQDNSWLLQNPTNDVRRDYFARKLVINGAKDVGDWGDKGDIVKCNTIYYGWRTSPDGGRQVFLIANMEGQLVDRCPLNIFLNLKGEWQVAAASPTLGRLPDTVTHEFVIENFKNGEALLLQRSTA